MHGCLLAALSFPIILSAKYAMWAHEARLIIFQTKSSRRRETANHVVSCRFLGEKHSSETHDAAKTFLMTTLKNGHYKLGFYLILTSMTSRQMKKIIGSIFSTNLKVFPTKVKK